MEEGSREGGGGRKMGSRRDELEGGEEGETRGMYPVSSLTRTLIFPDTALGVKALGKPSGRGHY